MPVAAAASRSISIVSGGSVMLGRRDFSDFSFAGLPAALFGVSLMILGGCGQVTPATSQGQINLNTYFY